MRDGIHRISGIPVSWRPLVEAVEPDADWREGGAREFEKILKTELEPVEQALKTLRGVAAGQSTLLGFGEELDDPLAEQVRRECRVRVGQGASSEDVLRDATKSALERRLRDRAREIGVVVEAAGERDAPELVRRLGELIRQTPVGTAIDALLQGARIRVSTRTDPMDFDADVSASREKR